MRWNYVISCTRDKDRTSECYNVWIDSSVADLGCGWSGDK